MLVPSIVISTILVLETASSSPRDHDLQTASTKPVYFMYPFAKKSVEMHVSFIQIEMLSLSLLVFIGSINAFSPHNCARKVQPSPSSSSPSSSSSQYQTHLFQESAVSGRVLPPQYFKDVYEENSNGEDDDGKGTCTKPPKDSASAAAAATPWDIGGGRPQPAIVKAYEKGQLRGRILDAGCGAGENCIYLADKYGVTSVYGCDLAPGAIRVAEERVQNLIMEHGHGMGKVELEESGKEEGKDVTTSTVPISSPFWTRPDFFVASCTEMAAEYHKQYTPGYVHDKEELELFDVSIDSGLLHCLSDEIAKDYVQELAKLVKPDTGRAYVGCFSTKNPAESWDNPRRLSPDYLRNLFCEDNGWEVVSIVDEWWARPPQRGSSQGAFSMALWMEARRL